MLEFVIYYICVIIFLSAAICGIIWSFVYWTLSSRATLATATVNILGFIGTMMWVYWFRTRICPDCFFHYYGVTISVFVGTFCFCLAGEYLYQRRESTFEDCSEVSPVQSKYQILKDKFMDARVFGRAKVSSLSAYFLGMVICYALGFSYIVAVSSFLTLSLLDFVWLYKLIYKSII